MRLGQPGSPAQKAAKRPAPQQPDKGGASGGAPQQFLHVDIVGGHLRLVPMGAGKMPAEQTPMAQGVAKDADGPELVHAVAKAVDEKRYTFGPLYTPGESDEHGEFVTRGELEKAMHGMALRGLNRTVNKQHRTGVAPVGHIVDFCVWPYEQEVELQLPGRDVRKAVLPAGTAYVGVIWDKAEWPGVKGGAVTGYSLGGRAMRVQQGAVLPSMRR